MRSCGTGIAPSRGCASTARRAARCGPTSSRPSSRRCSRWRRTAFPFFTSGDAHRAPRRPRRSRRRVLSRARCAWLGQRRARALGCAPGARLRRGHAGRRPCRGSPPACLRRAPGQPSTEPTTRQRAYVERLLGRCERVGPVAAAVGRRRRRRARRPRHPPDPGRARPDPAAIPASACSTRPPSRSRISAFATKTSPAWPPADGPPSRARS